MAQRSNNAKSNLATGLVIHSHSVEKYQHQQPASWQQSGIESTTAAVVLSGHSFILLGVAVDCWQSFDVPSVTKSAEA